MNHYVAVNILDMLNAIGEDAVKNILSDFLCPNEDRPKLLVFYENEQNRFRVFGERYSDKDQVKYIQLLRLF